MDLALLNAHLLHRQKTGKRVLLAQFQMEVIRQLIQQHKPNSTHRKRKADLPSRLTERHFMDKLPPTAKKAAPTARCVVCLSKKKRKESRYHCKQCIVGLCIEPCFEQYHTLEDF